MNTALINIAATAAPALTQETRYPVERCRMLRRTAIVQARKARDGRDMARCLEWLGYAVYWSGRARKRLETVDETQARTDARMLAWANARVIAAVVDGTPATVSNLPVQS